MPENTDGFNETQLKEIQKEAKSLSKWFENIAKIKTSDPQALQLDGPCRPYPMMWEFIHLYQAYKDKVRSFLLPPDKIAPII